MNVECIRRYLDQELGVPEGLVELQSVSEERVQRVAHEVFRRVIESVVPTDEIRSIIMQRTPAIDFDVSKKIFTACIEAQKKKDFEKIFVESARLCAQKDAWVTAANFKNFRITDPRATVEIAMLCAEKDGAETAENFKKFGITNQADCIKIAMLCARQDGAETLFYLKNFGITDPQAIVEIVKICAQQNGWGVAEYFNVFNIGIQDSRVMEVVVYCLAHLPNAFKNAQHNKGFFGLGLPSPIHDKLTTVYQGAQDIVQDPSSELITALRGQEGFDESLTIPGNKEILLSIICFCLATEKADALRSPSIQKAISSLLWFRDPQTKLFVRDSLFDVISEGGVEELEGFFEGKIPTRAQSAQLAYVFMTMLFRMKNIAPSLREGIANDFLKHLRTSFSSAARTAAFIQFVLALNDAAAGAEDQKQFYKRFVSDSIRDKDALSKNLMPFRAAVALAIDVADLTYEQIQKEVSKRLPLPEGWQKTFEPLRKSESLFIYAARINSLSEPDRGKVLEALRTWTAEVQDGTFLENRYSQSPQLQKMKENLPAGEWDELISRWRTGRKENFGGFNSSS